jgi:polyhydroxybutyrate depolymerase
MAKLAPLAFTVCFALQAEAVAGERMEFGGVTRTYAAIVPEQKPAPLVIVLHGNTQQGADMETRTSWPDVARRERLAAVFPDGLNRGWADLRAKKERIGRLPPEGTDDIAFLSALIEKLIADGVADAKRIYVTGLSNGAAMSMSMLCARADIFAAAAAVIMNLTDGLASSCRPARPVPILFMNGTEDPLVPFNGGKGTAWYAADGFWSTPRTVQFWRDTNGCEPRDASSTNIPDRDPSDGSTVTLISSACPPGRDVLLYRVNGGGHRFPGRAPDARMRRLADGSFGPQNHDIDGPEVIWEFFKRFERP